jgi:catechol 2,3-dioxygenase-like lactoylglutathione lyase family enzyme
VATTIQKLDFVGVPSRDPKRVRAFYVETLGLRPDEHSPWEFWVGETCFAIWSPAEFGLEFEPQRNASLAFHVDDIDAARAELEAKGVEFLGETFDTGVCWMARSAIPTGTT